MIRPGRTLAPFNRATHIRETLLEIVDYFGYDADAPGRMPELAVELSSRAWYPLPVRARCTLTVEGAMYPLIGPGA